MAMRFQPGMIDAKQAAALTKMAAKLDHLSTQINRVEVGQVRLEKFPAKITAVDGSTPKKYSWTEQFFTSAGIYEDKINGRVGTTTDMWAYERNGNTAATFPFYAELTRRCRVDGTVVFEFDLTGATTGTTDIDLITCVNPVMHTISFVLDELDVFVGFTIDGGDPVDRFQIVGDIEFKRPTFTFPGNVTQNDPACEAAPITCCPPDPVPGGECGVPCEAEPVVYLLDFRAGANTRITPVAACLYCDGNNTPAIECDEFARDYVFQLIRSGAAVWISHCPTAVADCGWVAPFWQLYCSAPFVDAEENGFPLVDGYYLSFTDGPVPDNVYYFLAATSWDCLGPNTLTKIFADETNCNYPSTLTVVPE